MLVLVRGGLCGFACKAWRVDQLLSVGVRPQKDEFLSDMVRLRRGHHAQRDIFPDLFLLFQDILERHAVCRRRKGEE